MYVCIIEINMSLSSICGTTFFQITLVSRVKIILL